MSPSQLPGLARMLLLVLTVAGMAGGALGAEFSEVVYTETPETFKGYLCRPAGNGPFPAVAFNHGGVGNIMGGVPKETCQALAAAGYVAFAPIRRQTRAMTGHLDDVQAGLAYLLGLGYVDRSRVAMAGFARGGALTFMAAARGAPIKAAVIMASAMPPRDSGFTLDDAPKIRVPVLLLVAENDTGSRKTVGQNTVETVQQMSDRLSAAGNAPKLVVYPAYGSDGHEMFFEIGAYWKDVLDFLKKHL
jgi:dienelactone hydrolase